MMKKKKINLCSCELHEGDVQSFLDLESSPKELMSSPMPKGDV